MTTVLLDSHVVHWWSAEHDRLSSRATQAVSDADEIAVASISWFELAWLAKHERIVVTIPFGNWLDDLVRQMRTVGISPPASPTPRYHSPRPFPDDPADRLIYATAVQNGWRLVTKDQRLRKHRHPHPVAVW